MPNGGLLKKMRCSDDGRILLGLRLLTEKIKFTTKKCNQKGKTVNK